VKTTNQMSYAAFTARLSLENEVGRCGHQQSIGAAAGGWLSSALPKPVASLLHAA